MGIQARSVEMAKVRIRDGNSNANRINPIIQGQESECGIRNYILFFQYNFFLIFNINLLLG